MLKRKVIEFISLALKNEDMDYMTYIRAKLTDFYLTIFSIVLIIPIAASLYRIVDIGWKPIFAVHIFIGITLFITSIFRGYITTTEKSIILIASSYIAGLVGLLQLGLLSMGISFFLITSILSFVLLELKSFQIVATFTTVSIILIGIFYPDGVLQSDIDLYEYVQSTKVWILIAIAYLFLLISILSGVGIILYSLYGILREVKSQKKELSDLNIKLQKLSITDNLTQVLNRMGINDALNKELKLQERYEYTFGIILLDIDYFKQVNDGYGHDVGDAVLVSIANLLKTQTRGTDYIGRWGGEEFLIICPEINKDNIKKLSEALRKSIEEYMFEDIGTITSSFGTAIANKDESVDKLVKRADDALYKAKGAGRNCVYSV